MDRRPFSIRPAAAPRHPDGLGPSAHAATESVTIDTSVEATIASRAGPVARPYSRA
ncbi:hypothetical protein AB0L33_10625 [Streptomyces sp. NPDC052299]|uniref:hypothetical protein n=1 Tax=Streptomyces sp. NPDC052299 TaxID=3155054 RepID=UPI00343B4C87